MTTSEADSTTMGFGSVHSVANSRMKLMALRAAADAERSVAELGRGIRHDK